jgi:hypothetical protein
MRDKEFLWLVLLLLVVVLGVCGMFFARNSDREYITNWAAESGYELISVEETWFDHGPFWFVDDDDRIYRVEVRDEREHPRTSYFRFRLFGVDQAWKE